MEGNCGQSVCDTCAERGACGVRVRCVRRVPVPALGGARAPARAHAGGVAAARGRQPHVAAISMCASPSPAAPRLLPRNPCFARTHPRTLARMPPAPRSSSSLLHSCPRKAGSHHKRRGAGVGPAALDYEADCAVWFVFGRHSAPVYVHTYTYTHIHI